MYLTVLLVARQSQAGGVGPGRSVTAGSLASGLCRLASHRWPTPTPLSPHRIRPPSELSESGVSLKNKHIVEYKEVPSAKQVQYSFYLYKEIFEEN